MIDTAPLGFALGAGLVAALNPCGFAFLPGYLALVIAGGSQITSRPAALARAGAATVVMSAGFLTVFGIFGLLISPLITSVQKYLPFATVIIGVVLIAVAGWLLAGRDIAVVTPKLSGGAPTARLRSLYGYGVAYAVASLSCTIGPFLALISTTFHHGSTLSGVLAFVVYAGGMAITVGVAALAVAFAGSSATGVIRRILPYIGRLAGAVVLLTGLYVTYYGYYEIRLYFTAAGPDDPLIHAAGALQTWLVRRVEAVGVWPLLGVLVALWASALAWRILTRRKTRRRTTLSGD
ncbi:cytochrome c biogenesis protein CcdA [Mycobacterium sp.]|uniref:cytochrome c biogenesis CcdA family protein n=1 Tax=Mycobacterium sp. TaxID=1785 RepID=UPI0012118A24|nr:cytochrome c biogenesis protein CcdA [Mycobacterium sp.]TAM68861.1 MAG: cytochrome c biogenesis protein CcdA [Mycobacterium sp.]